LESQPVSYIKVKNGANGPTQVLKSIEQRIRQVITRGIQHLSIAVPVTLHTSTHHGGAISAVPAQVLTFSSGDEVYGVDILRVREIRGWSPVTPIARTPVHILGVLNLRGLLVPIVDLRLRLALSPSECTPLTVIIVVSVETPSGERQFGLVVDRVSDVVDIRAEHVKPMPTVEQGRRESQDMFVQALATVEDRMIILVNLGALFRADFAISNLPAAPGMGSICIN
jgi:purine-binding chemotaxis protein CheW